MTFDYASDSITRDSAYGSGRATDVPGGPPHATAHDVDRDGQDDMWVVDADRDGRPEMILKDRDGDGRPDLVEYDRDENNVVEHRAGDANGDGRFDGWTYDRNQDGSDD